MSAMTPHIRVLRAEAAALNRATGDCSRESAETDALHQKAVYLTVGLVLGRMALAKSEAADALEAEEAELEQRLWAERHKLAEDRDRKGKR